MRILRILWKQGPRTVRQVKDAITRKGGNPPAYTTVMTLMNRLVGRGFLQVDREQQPFVYRSAIRKD